MLLRPATPADLAALQLLEQASPGAAHWDAASYAALFAPGSPSRLALVAEEAAELQGFLIARLLHDEAEIENIVVASSARRRGLGARLLRQSLRLLRRRGVRTVWLEVRASNAAARALYRKCAFTEGGRRPRYYRDPEEEAILYRLIFGAITPPSAVVEND